MIYHSYRKSKLKEAACIKGRGKRLNESEFDDPGWVNKYRKVLAGLEIIQLEVDKQIHDKEILAIIDNFFRNFSVKGYVRSCVEHNFRLMDIAEEEGWFTLYKEEQDSQKVRRIEWVFNEYVLEDAAEVIAEELDISERSAKFNIYKYCEKMTGDIIFLLQQELEQELEGYEGIKIL